MKNIHLVIGGFGFIGNQLITHLLSLDEYVFCVDDDSSGNAKYSIEKFKNEKGLRFLIGDVTKDSTKRVIIKELEDRNVVVWHLAANSDIRSGSIVPALDAQKTFMSTVAICDLSKDLVFKGIMFASTSAVYGELTNYEMFNESSICDPISYYGISKYASEKFLEINARNLGVPLLIFRFANIVGTPATHGVLYDFINKIKLNPSSLSVLGNGEQTKSYLHVETLTQMMFSLWSKNEVGVFNLGPGDVGISVREIADLLVNHLENPAEITYGTSPRGWDGDAIKVLMSSDKLDLACRVPKKSSTEAIHQAIHDISQQIGLDIICPDSENQMDRF